MKHAAFLIAAALSLCSLRAEYVVHDFVNSDSGLMSNGLDFRPVLNNNGFFAFGTNTSLYEGRMGLVYGNISTPGTLHQLNDVYSGGMSVSSYAINDHNDVLWIEDDFGDRTLATVNIATPNAPVFYNDENFEGISGRSLGMNNNGLFTFRNTLGGSKVIIYDSNTSTSREVNVTGNLRWEGPSAVNDHGQVIYGSDNTGASFAVYDWNTDTVTALAPSNATIPKDQSLPTVQPTLNNQGLAAFFAVDNESEEKALFTLDINTPQGEAQLIAKISQHVTNPISINDSGQILFVELADNGSGWEESLKLWDGESLHTLISTGDAFRDSFIFELYISGNALNNRGDIVFGYWLDDGTRGIGYAAIPEPATFALIGSGAALLHILQRRRYV